MRHLAVLEPTATGYSAYLPDLPGCVAAGETEEETLDVDRRAVALHLDGMREDGQGVPPPRAEGHILEVA
jgi:predicted RNase H-like HicB family nuclease